METAGSSQVRFHLWVVDTLITAVRWERLRRSCREQKQQDVSAHQLNTAFREHYEYFF